MELAGPEPELTSVRFLPEPYLEDFQRLGEQIFHYIPTSQNADSATTSDVKTPPDLVIFCSWMGASSRNVRKYLSTYQVRFPSTPILLLKQDGGDLFWRPKSVSINNLKPALCVVRNIVEARKPSTARVLLHVFSNGGSFTASQLTDSYFATTRKLLPISALILDSTPSLPNARRAHEAISESLPKSGAIRVLGQGAIWAYIGVGKAVDKVLGLENITIWLRKKLNDPEGAFTQGTLKRVYIYSQADRLIPFSDVEAHAREAETIIGNERVQLEDFVTSRHVGHLIVDGNRYWNIVEGLWKESVDT